MNRQSLSLQKKSRLSSKKPEFLTTGELAELLRYSKQTIFRRLKAGQIKSVRLGKNGDYRIPVTEVARLMHETTVRKITKRPATIRPPVFQEDLGECKSDNRAVIRAQRPRCVGSPARAMRPELLGEG